MLGKLQEKETCLFLHAITLSDYLRAKIIPRGLRITKKTQKNQNIRQQRQQGVLWPLERNLEQLFFWPDGAPLTIKEISILNTNWQQWDRKSQRLINTFRIIWEIRRNSIKCEQHKYELEKEIKISKKKKSEQERTDYDKVVVYKWRLLPTEDHTSRRGGRWYWWFTQTKFILPSWF